MLVLKPEPGEELGTGNHSVTGLPAKCHAQAVRLMGRCAVIYYKLGAPYV